MNISKKCYLLLCSTLLAANFACNPPDQSQNHHPPEPVDTTGWTDYQNADYNLALKLPQDWIVIENSALPNNNFVTNIFPPGRGAESALPLDVHGDASLSYLAIFPKGFGTELPAGQSVHFASANVEIPDLQFAVNQEESSVFLLKNESVWGYFIRPQTPPAGWSEEGFVFAQYAVDDFQARCFDQDTGAPIEMENCDPMAGDRFVREGQVVTKEAAVINGVLSSLKLENMEVQTPIRDMVRVSAPLPNLDIRSPYTVEGEAVGTWYFEGSFPVRLYDADDNLLAEGMAEAQGNWMTEDFVPFEATLTFDAPDDERGALVLERANPSGLPKNERSYRLPVLFPPTSQ